MANEFIINDFNGRRKHWRSLREQISNQSIDIAMKAVVEYISMAPISTRSIDLDHPENWPTPWELLNKNTFCELTTVLLGFYTLYYSGYKPSLNYIISKKYEIQGLITSIDNLHIGLEYSKVIKNIKLPIIHSYEFIDDKRFRIIK